MNDCLYQLLKLIKCVGAVLPFPCSDVFLLDDLCTSLFSVSTKEMFSVRCMSLSPLCLTVSLSLCKDVKLYSRV